MTRPRFFETYHCTSGHHCRVCRDRDHGRRWRASIAQLYEIPGVDWDCPPERGARPWGFDPDTRPPWRRRAERLAAAALRRLHGRPVVAPIANRRRAACLACELCDHRDGRHYCGAPILDSLRRANPETGCGCVLEQKWWTAGVSCPRELW